MTAERRPLSVGLFSPGWPPAARQSGIVTYVANLRPGLEHAGVGVTVLTNEVAPGADSSDATHVTARQPRAVRTLVWAASKPLGFSLTGVTLAFPIARGANQLRGLDLLEMEESFGAARYVQHMTRVPIVVRLHGPHFLHAPVRGQAIDPAFAEAERRCIAEAVAITSPARDVLDRVRSEYQLPLPDAVVIPNPVPIVPPERRWSLAGCDRKTILFVGRFDRHKGGDLVIDAFSALATRWPQAELLFVGPDQSLRSLDGPAHSIGDYIDQHVPQDLRSRIHVLGALPGGQIEGLRRQAFVTVVASRYEVFGLALAEALAFGCPTVAANVGGIPEVLLGERTGLLFQGGDAADLAAKIEVLFANPERAAALGGAAPADMAARMSPDVVGRATAAYYQSVRERSPRVTKLAPFGALLRALNALSR